MPNPDALVGELEAMQERLRIVEQTWLAHVEATTRMNAAVPDVVNGTPAERAVYDERYRVAEEARREVYRVTQSLAIWAAENKAADAIDKLLATLKAQREALEPFAAVADAFDYWVPEAMPEFEYPLHGQPNLAGALEDCPNAVGSLCQADFDAARAALEGKPAS